MSTRHSKTLALFVPLFAKSGCVLDMLKHSGGGGGGFKSGSRAHIEYSTHYPYRVNILIVYCIVHAWTLYSCSDVYDLLRPIISVPRFNSAD